VLSPDVVRVKIWTPAGRILYSDEPRLIGDVFPLEPEERDAIRAGKVAAAVSDLSKPENRFERSHGKLLEVYLPVHAADGQPLLYENYLRFSSIAANSRRVWTS